MYKRQYLYFSSEEISNDFKDFYVDQKFLIREVLKRLYENLNMKIPVSRINLVFVPNLEINQDRPHHMHYSGVNILSEDIILRMNMVENRPQSYF